LTPRDYRAPFSRIGQQNVIFNHVIKLFLPMPAGRTLISCRAIFLISPRLQPGESCAGKMETVSTVFRTRSHQAVETAWSRIANTHRAEARG
jgi:hypothetical protein